MTISDVKFDKQNPIPTSCYEIHNSEAGMIEGLNQDCIIFIPVIRNKVVGRRLVMILPISCICLYFCAFSACGGKCTNTVLFNNILDVNILLHFNS